MLKDLVQAFLRRFGVKLSRIAVNEAPLVPFNVFEHVLFKEIHAAGEMFRFIQIGANDGVMSDNLAPLIRKYSITGCLVEPMPDVFLELVSNYSDQPQLLFKNYLISSNDVGEKIYRFKRDAPVPQEFYHGLARQDSEYIIKRAAAAGLPNHIEEIVCNAKTFAELYSELGWKSLNLLYVDTEGSDDRIIYQALEAEIFPSIINFEWTEMTAKRNYDLKLKLLDHGYRFIDVGADTICVRELDARAKN